MFSSLFIYKQIVGLNQKYIKTTTIQTFCCLTTFPNQNIYSAPPQKMQRGRTQIRPQHSQTWQGYMVRLISFAQKLYETFHISQNGNHLLLACDSHLDFHKQNLFLMRIMSNIYLNLTQICIFKNTMPRRFARAGFLEDPGMHPAQMNGALGTSLPSREGKPMAKKPLIRSCAGGAPCYTVPSIYPFTSLHFWANDFASSVWQMDEATWGKWKLNVKHIQD